jgi:hypothetical protein
VAGAEALRRPGFVQRRGIEDSAPATQQNDKNPLGLAEEGRSFGLFDHPKLFPRGRTMTEAEWLACEDPRPMLELLTENASDRKLKLFATASFRHITDLLPDSEQQRAIEMLEQMAEGTATKEARSTAIRDAHSAIPPEDWVDDGVPADHLHFVALILYRALASSDAAGHAVHAARGREDGAAERRVQSRLIRDLFGNPFRPVTVDTEWLTSTVIALAQQMYDSRDFSAMPILADALQDAGCENADILTHCRGPGPHVRGCWVVDLVLGKE